MKELSYLISILLAFLCIFFYTKYKKIRFLYDTKDRINNTMLKISEELREFEDIDELYKKILNDTISLIRGAECGSVLIYNRESGFMEYRAAVGYDMNFLSRVFLRREELYLYRINRLMFPEIIRNPLMFDKKYMDRKNYRSLKKNSALDIKSCLSAPIYVRGHFYGIINVDSRTNVDGFDKMDIRLMQYIARQMEIFITNALLMNELKESSRVDKLTELYNRTYFEEIMEDRVKRAEAGELGFHIVMIDMDNFKVINDTFGHKMGDEALRYFARILKHAIGNDNLAIRYAGDEFVVAFFNKDDEYILGIIQKIKNYLYAHPYGNINIDFSAGVSQYKKGSNLDKIIISADNKMYTEKREKKME